MKLKEKFVRLTKKNRLHEVGVPVIGLTGGIASGKSTVGRLLMAQGLSVINADHLVKDVYALPEVFSFVSENYPEVVKADAIVFPLLREKVFSDASVKARIETFIYQKLPQAFMIALKKLGPVEAVVYDVPLLFEKNMQEFFDLTVLVYAPRKTQRDRLMTRDGHQEHMAETILNQQMDIEEKRLKSDFIIANTASERELTEEVNQFLRQTFE